MAIGILSLMFIGILILSILFSVLMIYFKNTNKERGTIIISAVFGVLIALLNASSLPMNFTGQILIAIIIGFLSVVGVVLSFTKLSKTYAPQIFIIVSIFATVLKLFF